MYLYIIIKFFKKPKNIFMSENADLELDQNIKPY